MTDRVAQSERGAIAQPADFLTGDWIMTRRIRFRGRAARGSLEGHASVRADGHHSSLSEQGLLRLDGREAMASQRYALTFRGAVVQVYFRNGSFFHEFELRRCGYTTIIIAGRTNMSAAIACTIVMSGRSSGAFEVRARITICARSIAE